MGVCCEQTNRSRLDKENSGEENKIEDKQEVVLGKPDEEEKESPVASVVSHPEQKRTSNVFETPHSGLIIRTSFPRQVEEAGRLSRCPYCRIFLATFSASAHIEECGANSHAERLLNQLRSFQSIIFDYMRSDDIPFVALTKQHKYGKVYWTKEDREKLSEEEYKRIAVLPLEKAKKLKTEEKRLWLYGNVDKMKARVGKESVVLVVERANFLRDAFEQFKTTGGFDLRKEIRIHFIDEEAQDAGGLIREWFSLITEKLFEKKIGLFQKANTPELSYIINEHSHNYNANHLEMFFFAGQVLAKALFERIPVKSFLNYTIIKCLLGEKIQLEDFKQYDKELWQSLWYISTTKIDKTQQLTTFSVSTPNKNPKMQSGLEIELKRHGKDIIVEDSNKDEFIDLFIQYHVKKKVESQLEQLLMGFYSLLPHKTVSALDADEFEFFLGGDSNINIEDWKRHTIYKGSYNADHNVIKWFWITLAKLKEDDKRKFLQYCTGATRLPVEGFQGLMSNNGKVCTFCIEPKDYICKETAFIIAHTCFNRIELPLFPNRIAMEDSIMTILSNPHCSSFGFE